MRNALSLFCSFVLTGYFGLGCATSSSRLNYPEHLAAYDVPVYLADKMQARLPLELVDIQQLAGKGVPDTLIIGYLKQEQSIYQLTSDHVTMMLDSGVSKAVVDYLLLTPGTHGRRSLPVFYYPVPPPPVPYYPGFTVPYTPL